MFFYRELSQLAATDPYFANVGLLLRGAGEVGNSSGTILDESSNAFSTTVGGDVALSSTIKKYGSYSMKFDGNGDYINLSPGSAFQYGTGNFTVEAWVNFSVLQSCYFVDARNGGQTNTWAFFFDNAGKFLYWYDGSTQTGRSWNPSINTWYHVAYCRNGSSGQLYVDGVALGASISDGTNYTVSPATSTIGARFSASDALNGYMDDLRITKGVARYTVNFTPPAAELPASSPADPDFANVSLLLRGTGTRTERIILDESPNTFSTTIAGNTTLSSAVKKYGTYSINFDGNGDYLTVPSSTAFGFGTGNFTIEYWSYPTRNTINETMVDTRPGDIGAPLVLGKASDGSVRCYDGSSVRTGGSMTLNAWNHVAWCRNGTSNVIYLNGVSVISFTNGFDAGASRGLTIGANVSNAFENCQGYIDDLRITKGVARYTANFTPPTEELPAS